MGTFDFAFRNDFYQLDPNQKDEKWADRLITQMRRDGVMQPFVQRRRAQINRAYLLGEESVERYKKTFDKPDEVRFKWESLGIFEKPRNILTAEREKAGVQVQLNAIDPTAQDDRVYDRDLLANSPMIEQMLTQLQISIGLPPYSLAKDTEKGKFTKGNLDQFKNLGLDPNSPEDITYFFKTHYRLDVEIEAEQAVNYYNKACKIEEYLKYWCDDILAVRAVAGRAFADEVTNSPSFSYIRPEDIWWMRGKELDGQDASAIMSIETLTMEQVLARINGSFTLAQWKDLMDVAAFHNEGFRYDGVSYIDNDTKVNHRFPESCSNPCEYYQFMSMKINLGYIEWKSQDVDTYKVGKDFMNNMQVWDKPFGWVKGDKSKYEKQIRANVFIYKAYFLPKSLGHQVLFKFGKLYDQQTYGDDGEKSKFSFQIYKKYGKSAIELAMPHIDTITETYFKFRQTLDDAKPAGRSFDLDVVMELAREMESDTNPSWNAVNKIFDFLRQSKDSLHKRVEGAGGDGKPFFDMPIMWVEGLVALANVMQSEESQMYNKLGINDIRQAGATDPKVAYRTQVASLEQSRNATADMFSIMQSILDSTAEMFVGIVQDQLRFKGTAAYKNIERGIGITAVDRIKSLENIPMRKFGIFVESFNVDIPKQQMQQRVEMAFERKEIPLHVLLLIQEIDNYKKAGEILAYENAKQQKIKQKEAEQAQQYQLQVIQANEQKEMNTINAKGEWDLKNTDNHSQAMIAVANIAANNNLQTNDQKTKAEPFKQGVRTKNKIEQEQGKEDIKRQQPLDTDQI